MSAAASTSYWPANSYVNKQASSNITTNNLTNYMVDKNTFTAGAVGSISSSNSSLDTWQIDYNGVLQNFMPVL